MGSFFSSPLLRLGQFAKRISDNCLKSWVRVTSRGVRLQCSHVLFLDLDGGYPCAALVVIKLHMLAYFLYMHLKIRKGIIPF